MTPGLGTGERGGRGAGAAGRVLAGETVSMTMVYLLLADLILVLHAAVVLFNVVSLPLIWLGRWRGWRCVRNFYFRALHVGLMAFVAVQALANEICPLTTWENCLRLKAGEEVSYPGSFIAHWVQRFLYHEADARFFATAYVCFFALVLATWFWVRPEPPGWWQRRRARRLSNPP